MADLMAEYFAMGGYGPYIWPAYALSALALGGLYFWRRRGLRRAQQAEKNTPERRATPVL